MHLETAAYLATLNTLNWILTNPLSLIGDGLRVTIPERTEFILRSFEDLPTSLRKPRLT